MPEVTEGCIEVWGAGRVVINLAPRADVHWMGDSNRAAMFGYVAREIGRRKLPFLCAREALGPDRIGPLLKEVFGGVYVANENVTRRSAETVIAAGEADAVAFGKAFLAKPDPPRRLKEDAPLNVPRQELLYARGPEGYTDYPALSGD